MENEFLDKMEDNAELKEIWAQWDDEVKWLFYYNYALAQFWNSAYSCFTFGEVDLVPTIEEYTVLLRCPKIQADKVYSKAVNVTNFVKKLMNILGMMLRYIDEAVTDLFDRLDKRVTPVPAILAETFRSLNACRSAELATTPRRDNITDKRWMSILQNLKDEDVEWRAPWMVPDEILYRCGDFDRVPLLGIWGAVGYASL
ncbi:hypothetical protein Gohar_021380, partial [Gossypium harknessii]|nr:hypothetical protein [Gossypium harknessii]